MNMRKLFLLFTLLLALALLWQPQAGLQAMQQGLQLCAGSLILALFPFLVVSNLLVGLGLAAYLGRLLRPLQRYLPLSGAGVSALLLGLVGGYPVGAGAVRQLYEQGQCSQKEAQRLLAFCNNASPAFFLHLVGLGVFGSAKAGLLLYLLHVLSALLVALFFAPRQKSSAAAPTVSAVSLSAVFTRSVGAALSSALHICAYVLVFQVLLQLLATANLLPGAGDSLLRALFCGLLELTCGTRHLANNRASFVLAAFLCSWGGLSVHCQTMSLLQGSGLSTRCYWSGKLLQALFSALLAALVIFLFS